jgi:hypothetical protein
MQALSLIITDFPGTKGFPALLWVSVLAKTDRTRYIAKAKREHASC